MEYRVATKEEVAKQFDWLIDTHDDKKLWTNFKNKQLIQLDHEEAIPYYGFIDNDCICEAYAIKTNAYPNRVYLKAFRTRPEYRNQHYFTGLFNYMIEDLRKRGYNEFTVGVESEDTINKSRYMYFGFTEYLETHPDIYSDGSIHLVEYYLKKSEN